MCGHTATAEDVANDAENEILAQLVDAEGNYSNPVRVAPIGHQIEKWTTEGATAPTTTTEGTLIGKCKYCTHTNTVVIPKLNRTDYAYEVVEGKSCNEENAIKYTLSTFKGLPVEGDEWLAAGKHVNNTVEFVAGDVFLEGSEESKLVKINLFENAVLDCSETNVNNAGILCEECDTIITVTQRKAHVEKEGTKVVVEATCTTDGSIDFDCSVCLEHVHKVVPATGIHNMVYTIAEVLGADGQVASYTVSGECSMCGMKVADIKAKKVETEVIKPATCTETGEVKYTVTLPNDDIIEIKGTIDKTAHKDSKGNFVDTYTDINRYEWKLNGDNGEFKLRENEDPTCATGGFNVYYLCSECDELIAVPAVISHTAPEGFAGKTVVCTAEEAALAANQYECQVCHQTVSPIVAGHTFGQVTGVEEDKDADGTKEWYAVKVCSVCNHKEYLNNGEPITIAEDAEPIKSEASTCEVAGYDIYDVEVKDGEKTVTIQITIAKALANHKYANGTEITPAEREKVHALDGIDNPLGIKFFEGQKTACNGEITEENGGVICPVCEQIIPLKVSAPHTWGVDPETKEAVRLTQATCTTAAVIEKYCTICQAWRVDESMEVQPALGHSYKATVATQPSETAEGTATVSCERCDAINVTITLPKLSDDKVWTKVDDPKTCVKDGKTTYTATLKVYADKADTVVVTIVITTPADGNHDFILDAEGNPVTSVWYTVDKNDPKNIVVTKYVGSYCKVEKTVIVTESTTTDAEGKALTEASIPAGAEVLDITAEHEVLGK